MTRRPQNWLTTPKLLSPSSRNIIRDHSYYSPSPSYSIDPQAILGGAQFRVQEHVKMNTHLYSNSYSNLVLVASTKWGDVSLATGRSVIGVQTLNNEWKDATHMAKLGSFLKYHHTVHAFALKKNYKKIQDASLLSRGERAKQSFLPSSHFFLFLASSLPSRNSLLRLPQY